VSSSFTPQDSGEERRSLGQVLGDVSADLSTLVRQELTLAKAEASQSASRAGKGIGMFAGAAVAGLLLLIFLSASIMWGLGQFIGNQWSALIVAVIWAIIAAILASMGRKEMKNVTGVPRTTDTVKKIPSAVAGNEETR
jgi:predicted lipid-binding transport protein (Tim44 family)